MINKSSSKFLLIVGLILLLSVLSSQYAIEKHLIKRETDVTPAVDTQVLETTDETVEKDDSEDIKEEEQIGDDLNDSAKKEEEYQIEPTDPPAVIPSWDDESGSKVKENPTTDSSNKISVSEVVETTAESSVTEQQKDENTINSSDISDTKDKETTAEVQGQTNVAQIESTQSLDKEAEETTTTSQQQTVEKENGVELEASNVENVETTATEKNDETAPNVGKSEARAELNDAENENENDNNGDDDEDGEEEADEDSPKSEAFRMDEVKKFEKRTTEAPALQDDFDPNGNNAEAENIYKTISESIETTTPLEATTTTSTKTTTTTTTTTTTSTSTDQPRTSKIAVTKNVYFKQRSLVFQLNDTFNDEIFINRNCPSLSCEFGFKTDLFGKPLCSCFNPCYEKNCGSKVCVIRQNSETDYEPVCYDSTKLERPTACYMPLKPGNCRNYNSRYYFNPFKNECLHFIFTGCNGNANNFENWESCQMECNTCSLPPAKGPCQAKIVRYYYDSAKRKCQGFEWGGCKGNENNFASRKHCEESCLFRKTGSLFLHGMPKKIISAYHNSKS